MNQREIVDKPPGIAGLPLLNYISHDSVLTLPQLHRMNNENQDFKNELKSAVRMLHEIKTITDQELNSRIYRLPPKRGDEV